ncbi:MAG: hypothetical protein QXJ96_00580 [Candidatus Aenigmatarchaeota archaeon]|nr:hypothetical protein [Candidatus Aenigmarchaeota archaeon]
MKEKKKNKKIKIAWFSFTGCGGDSSVVFMEILNKKWVTWRNLVELRHFSLVKEKRLMRSIDIAFIEGAISNKEEESLLKKIRKVSKVVVAVGSCAISGAPSNHRNFFDDKTIEEISHILKKFKYRDKVSSVLDIIKADATVPGCPMDEKIFIETFERYIKEMRGDKKHA